MRRYSRIVLALIFLPALVRAAEPTAPVIDRTYDAMCRHGRTEIRGRGFVIDSSHPQRPGDERREVVTLRFLVDGERGDAVMDFESGEGEQHESTRYFVRRGRPFQLADTKEEKAPDAYGDLAAVTVAALQPSLIAHSLFHARANAQLLDRRGDRATMLFAWNDSLWRVSFDGTRITRMERRYPHPVRGDITEVVRFSETQVSVTSGNREIARFELTTTPTGEPLGLPDEKENWQSRVLTEEDIVLREVAPHLFTIDFEQLDSRVLVVEFADHLAVLEGAFNTFNGDLIARVVQNRLKKPIRYFAFSHLHGQYVASVRSYVHAGATIVIPPTTAPLITEIVHESHELQPDALSRASKPLKMEMVKDRFVLADDTNRLEIYNVESGHTDEYFLFYLPAQKALITGDLFCYRGADVELRPRSKQLCATVKKLGLDVGLLLPSWPLHSYGCHNTVTGDEFRGVCQVK